MEEITNKVAASGLITLDLEDMVDRNLKRLSIDLKDHLFEGLLLREKDFRDWIKNEDWEVYRDSVVGVYCSSDAIIPTWAYMLVSSKLSGVAAMVVQGDQDTVTESLVMNKIN